jgi:hypothetical protein
MWQADVNVFSGKLELLEPTLNAKSAYRRQAVVATLAVANAQKTGSSRHAPIETPSKVVRRERADPSGG